MARIEQWYRRGGLEVNWTRERFERLCRQLHCTTDELGAMVGLNPKGTDLWLKRNRFPKPVCVLLAITDQTLAYLENGLQGPPIMPIHLLAAPANSTTGSTPLPRFSVNSAAAGLSCAGSAAQKESSGSAMCRAD